MTFTAAVARDRTRAAVVYLVDIQTLAFGPLLRLSDRNVIVAGVAYSDYIAGVSGVGDTLYRATGAFTSPPASITVRNDPYDTFTHLSELSETYPLEGAAVTIKTVCLDDDGTPATPETVFVGNFDSPTGVTGIAFTCAAICREAFISQRTR